MRQSDAPGILHRLDEIITGRGLTVVPPQIKLHPGSEFLCAEQGLQHTDHLGALVVNGGGIEIIDLHIGGRSHRMNHRPGILRKLKLSQDPHIIDPLDRRRIHIRGKLLIAEDRQPLFKTELEPVTAGHPITGPVVKIFVTDDRFDPEIIAIGGCFRMRQHILGVEDIQTLVLHRPHVEIIDSDDHIAVEIIFQAIHLFIPLHRFFQREHGMIAVIAVALLDINL